MWNYDFVVSARRGGQAESVLRFLADICAESEGNVWVRDASGRLSTNGVISRFPSMGDYKIELSLPMHFVLGEESGVVLRDVDSLSQERNFSTSHLAGQESEGIVYVFPISQRIAHVRSREHFELNLRRAALTIGTFLLQHQDGALLSYREAILEAERMRVARRAQHLQDYRHRRPSRLMMSRCAGSWGGVN